MDKRKTVILFVGDTSYDMYVKAYYKAALEKDDVDARIIDFGNLNTAISKNHILLRIERHYKNGLNVARVNRQIVKYVENNDVDIVFLYACDIVFARTVKKISEKAYVAIYNNDNPFSTYYSNYTWKNVIESLKFSDIVYSYRLSNIIQYQKAGATKVKLMRSYYIKERNYYILDENIKSDIPSVCYIGHYEDDGRMEFINELLKNGIDVGVPDDWNRLEIKNQHLIYIADSHKRYNEILNKAKIAIVFLSKINKDTYTRRCFEIPAVRTMMLAPYTEDLAGIYEDNKEAVFYRNKIDFVDKVKYYLEHEKERQVIADAGYKRLINSKNEVSDRVDQIVEDYRRA